MMSSSTPTATPQPVCAAHTDEAMAHSPSRTLTQACFRGMLLFAAMECWRSRFVWLVLCLLAISLGVAQLMGALAITEVETMRLVFGATAMRWLLGLALMLYTVNVITRDADTGFLMLLLAHPMSRAQYLVWRWLGLLLLCLACALLTGASLGVVSGRLWHLGGFTWLLSVLLEWWVMVTVALFFAMGLLRPIPAFMATLLFYGLSRSLDALQTMVAHPIAQDPNELFPRLSRWAIEAMSWLIPPLGRHGQTEWLLTPPADGLLWLATSLIWVLPTLLVFGVSALVDFHGHEL